MADRARLESVYTSKGYRGFESLPLRQFFMKDRLAGDSHRKAALVPPPRHSTHFTVVLLGGPSRQGRDSAALFRPAGFGWGRARLQILTFFFLKSENGRDKGACQKIRKGVKKGSVL